MLPTLRLYPPMVTVTRKTGVLRHDCRLPLELFQVAPLLVQRWLNVAAAVGVDALNLHRALLSLGVPVSTPGMPTHYAQTGIA